MKKSKDWRESFRKDREAWREHFEQDLKEITKNKQPDSFNSFASYLHAEYVRRYRLSGKLPRQVFIGYGLKMVGLKPIKRSKKKTQVVNVQYSLFK